MTQRFYLTDNNVFVQEEIMTFSSLEEAKKYVLDNIDNFPSPIILEVNKHYEGETKEILNWKEENL